MLEQLLDVEAVPLQPLRRLARRDSLRGERLALGHPCDVAGHEPDDSRQRVARGPAGASKQPFARLEHAGDIAPAPGVGHREGRDLAARGDEKLDLSLTDRLPVRPSSEFLDLARQLV